MGAWLRDLFGDGMPENNIDVVSEKLIGQGRKKPGYENKAGGS
jgi:hypothetical protein